MKYEINYLTVMMVMNFELPTILSSEINILVKNKEIELN